MLLLLLACVHKGPPSDLGALAADATPLTEAWSTKHLAAALPDGDTLTVGDLYRTEDLPFTQAPDPRGYLIKTWEHNQASPCRYEGDGCVPLRVLTYNVALLDARLLHLIPYAQSPYLKERRPALPDLILAQGHDVLLLQEVWTRRDVRRFKKAAEQHGYLAFTGPRLRYTDGVLTLIKQDLVVGTPEVRAEVYEARVGSENFPGVGIKRGFLQVTFEHPTLGPVTVLNTHMQAWPQNWAMRMSEARQLGAAAAAVEGEAPVVIVGGDMNGGVYYARDAWTAPDRTVVEGWWDNTVSYSMLAHYGEMLDAGQSGVAKEDVLLDVTLGDQVVNNPHRALEVPQVEDDWCAANLGRVFTATDCNVMYFEQYGGTEYPVRMDLLFLRDPARRVWVERSDIVFTEPVVFGELAPMQPSDHLGVEAVFRIAPP